MESSTPRAAYARAVERLLRFVIPKQRSVLEIGCRTGELLAALEPRDGVGVDRQRRRIERARVRHPQLEFHVCAAEQLDAPLLLGRTFDFIVLSDVSGELYDVWTALRALRRFCHAETRVVLASPNALWAPVWRLEEAGDEAGEAALEPSWLRVAALKNLLALCHLELIR